MLIRLLISLLCALSAIAQPDPREIPVPAIKTSQPKMLGVRNLPVLEGMPDVLVMNDGAKVTSQRQWQKQREEMKRILEYYAVGQMPPPPGNVKGKELKQETVIEGKVKYRLVHLTFGPRANLELDVGIFTPAEGGPFPVIILQAGSPPGSTAVPRQPQGPNQGRGENVLLLVGPGPAAAPRKGGPIEPAKAEAMAKRYTDVFHRGYAIATFNVNDCAEDTTLRNADGSWAFRNTRFPAAYPKFDWGILGAWAWGVSRVADYLETDRAIDKRRMIVTVRRAMGSLP
jgi:hypothetical protein